MEKLGERITTILSEKGLTQRELASEAGITQVSLSRYLSGERVPKATVLMQISKALGVSLDYLMGEKKSEREESRIMNLTLKTELGEFKFALSQTSVIYLLSLAQKLEDEGDPRTDINVVDDNINPNVDNVMSELDELRFPPEETADEERSFPEEAEQEEEHEDFGELLEEYEQKKKREWNEAQQVAGPPDGKYKGFLYIKCDHCGEVRGFCAKQPIDEYRCSECGGKTKLKGLRRMFLNCECGKSYRYYTNETAEVVTNNCINCGTPVDMMLNSRRTAYTTIGGGPKRKASSFGNIFTRKHSW